MSWYSDEDWRESRNGNHVLIVDGEVAATVYRKDVAKPWAIIINRDGVGYMVFVEFFEELDDAKARAIAVLNGADDACLMPVKPRKC
jgi:hypothetical protein